MHLTAKAQRSRNNLTTQYSLLYTFSIYFAPSFQKVVVDAMDLKKHYASGVIAFVIWGFFPLVLRMVNTHPAGEILYFRILFALLLLAVILFGFMRSKLKETVAQLKSLDPRARRTVILLTLSGGALLTINWLVFIYVVNGVNIKTASFSYLICPVVTAVLGYVLLKERMAFIQWLAIALCAVSCVLMGISNVS